jgi:hypothetical protein
LFLQAGGSQAQLEALYDLEQAAQNARLFDVQERPRSDSPLK